MKNHENHESHESQESQLLILSGIPGPTSSLLGLPFRMPGTIFQLYEIMIFIHMRMSRGFRVGNHHTVGSRSGWFWEWTLLLDGLQGMDGLFKETVPFMQGRSMRR